MRSHPSCVIHKLFSSITSDKNRDKQSIMGRSVRELREEKGGGRKEKEEKKEEEEEEEEDGTWERC